MTAKNCGVNPIPGIITFLSWRRLYQVLDGLGFDMEHDVGDINLH